MNKSERDCDGFGKSNLDADGLVASLLINALGLAIPIAMLQIFDRVLPNASLATLDALFVVMVCVVVLDALLKIMRARIVLGIGRAAEERLARRLLDRLFFGDLLALQRIGSSRLQRDLLSSSRLRVILSGQSALGRIDLAFSAVYLAIIAALAGWLVAIPIVTILTIGAIGFYFRPRHRAAVRAKDRNAERRSTLVRDTLARIRTLKLLVGEMRIMSRYAALHFDATEAQRKLTRIADSGYTTSAMAGQIATGALSLAGGYLVIVDALNLGSLAACIMLSGRSVQPFLQALLADGDLGQAHETRRTLRRLLAVPDVRPRPRAGGRSDDLIVIRDLDWRAGKDLPDLPDALSIAIARGTVVTIGGDRMDDPSAILRMLAGEQIPRAGRIHVDGARPDLGPAPGEPLRSVVKVSRTPTLYRGTIRQNLAAHLTNIVDAQAVSGLLDVHAEIDMLPEGIDWRHDGGKAGICSPGLVKKISLAAALASDAELLLLDTPTADLDPLGARLLADHLLMTKGLTTVVIANPNETLTEMADLHIELRANHPPHLSRPAHRTGPTESDRAWLSAMGTPEVDKVAS
ncbi:ABC transporter transmembrane domain-containing protein [Jannaschia aquimarina]|uniref:ApxIB_2 protein n=1 Tax=Jannaschia aquimarina TaxID=935700 RepID=A0A0D1DBB2_9RHOB|nr:ABC transporter transmembrane domain-containing protein [Jannaschia aquimarina]KIT17238.1 Toxin RTX-I translocation ATP-binding protein [Jannaschia aquimarina]SNT18931.1 ABC-type bacteriocin/lantibiotic exporter, contains an N-terminal double-glycine peptidase domain [Jannaschia aquimarina]